MARINNARCGDKDEDAPTERNLFARLLEDAAALALAFYLVKLGISYLVSVRTELIVLAVITVIILAVYRIWRWKDRYDD